MSYSIALDGPAGVGKSTIAKRIAEKLGFTYVDTGAMYRTLAVYFSDLGYKPEETEKIIASLGGVDIDIRYIDGEQHMFLNGTDVTGRLRTEAVSSMASITSSIPEVREKLKELQRSLAEKQNVIMDGRDIGTVILPNATVKIFLTASPKVRAMRRFRQLAEQGKLGDATPESIQKDIEERDFRDSHRSVAPLKAAEDAVKVDSSEMSIEEVVKAVVSELEKKIGNQSR